MNASNPSSNDRTRNRKSSRRSATPMFQSLEPRRLFAAAASQPALSFDDILSGGIFDPNPAPLATITDGVMLFEGSVLNDTMNVDVDGSTIKVRLNNGTPESYSAAGVFRIDVKPEAGDDVVIITGNLPAFVEGAAGNDTLVGGDANDTITAGAGRDFVVGNGGHDRLNGNGGVDKLRGMDGNDRLYGGDANDQLEGGNGVDRLYGEAGADAASGSGSNDKIYGGDGNDTCVGGKGDDLLYGEAGDDTLNGHDGNNLMSGGDGNDALFSGAGASVMNGNGGNDAFKSTGDGQSDTIDGGDGDDDSATTFEGDNVTYVEHEVTWR